MEFQELFQEIYLELIIYQELILSMYKMADVQKNDVNFLGEWARRYTKTN